MRTSQAIRQTYLLSDRSEVRILSWVPKALEMLCSKAFFFVFYGLHCHFSRSEYTCTVTHILLTKSERIRGLKERYAYKWQQLFFMIALCCGIFLPFDQFRKQFRMLLKHLPQLLKHITADLCLENVHRLWKRILCPSLGQSASGLHQNRGHRYLLPFWPQRVLYRLERP